MLKFLHALIFLLITLTIVTAQDECGNAPTLNLTGPNACQATHFTIDLSVASVSTTTPVPTCPGSWGSGKNDIWARFVVPAGVTQMNLGLGNDAPITGLFGAAKKPSMSVYRGSCAALTEISCYETPTGFISNNCRGFSYKTINVTPGETIFLRMWELNNAGIELDLIITPTTSAPPNDACANATPLSSIGCNVNATASGGISGTSMNAPESCNGAGSEGTTWNTVDNVVFYTFQVTPTTTQPVQITLNNVTCAGGCNEIQLAIYGGGCPGVGGSNGSTPANTTTYHGCNSGTGTVTVTSTSNLPPGTYYLAVDGCSAGLPVETSACMFGISSDVITVVLPLSIKSFTAERVGDEVALRWNSDNLADVSHFVMERSSNGIDFEEIGEITAHSSQNYYGLDDKDMTRAYEGHYYYRIRQVDFDGTESLTEVKVVEVPNDFNTITLFPNPALKGQPLYLKGRYSAGANVDVTLYNALGVHVLSKNFKADAGAVYLEIPTDNLNPGVYSLSIGEGNNKSVRKIVVR